MLQRPMHVAFPIPERDLDRAVREAAPVQGFLVSPSATQASTVANLIWEKVASEGLATLLYIPGHLCRYLFPADLPYGRNSFAASLALFHALVGLSVVRFRCELRKRRPPRWICRVVRLLPPGVFPRVLAADPEAITYLRRILDGNVAEVGVVYSLFGQAGYYVGKTLVRRASGALGCVARLLEHLRALFRPATRDGQKPRYRILRKSLGTLGFVPLVLTSSEQLAFATESLIIRMEKPQANLEDIAWDQRLRGIHPKLPEGTITAHKKKRRRPFPSFRVGSNPTASVWEQPISRAKLLEQEEREETLASQFVRGGFAELYRLQQTERAILYGLEGPLDIFAGDRLPVFLAYCCSRNPVVKLPLWNWSYQARFLYNAARAVPRYILGSGRQVVVRRVLEKLLRIHRLPPLTLPVLKIPACDRRDQRAFKASIKAAMGEQRCLAAAEWLRDNVRYTVARPRLWTCKFSAANKLRDFDPDGLMDLDDPVLAGDSAAPDLRAISGPWRLPMSSEFSRKIVQKKVRNAWPLWCRLARVHKAVVSMGWRSVFNFCRGVSEVSVPQPWLDQERKLCCSSGCVLAGDDRVRNKAWQVPVRQAYLFMFSSVLHTEGWKHKPLLREKALQIVEWAKMFAGIPAFLRRGALAAKTRVPSMFFLVKSKCFSDLGEKHAGNPTILVGGVC